MRHTTLLAVAGTLAACASGPCPEPESPDSSGQSYSQAIALMCNVDQRAGIDAETDLFDRAGRRSEFINDNVKNPDAIEYRTYFSVKPPSDQASSLREEAKRAGIDKCQLADSLTREPG